MRNSELKVVWVKQDTKDRLKAIGKKGETFEAIIVRLLDEYENIRR